MPTPTTTRRNPGQFSSWHMERAGDNKYSASDSSTKPAAGERSKTLVTDGRPAGTHFRDNPWHDGGAGDRGSRAHELNKYADTPAAKQSDNDAPFMKGDRSRTADGTLREVRSDQLVSNNPTLNQRAPELVAEFGGITVGELQDMFDGLSVSKIGEMTQAERAAEIQRPVVDVDKDVFTQGATSQTFPSTAQAPSFDQVGDTAQQGSITAQIAGLRAGS